MRRCPCRSVISASSRQARRTRLERTTRQSCRCRRRRASTSTGIRTLARTSASAGGAIRALTPLGQRIALAPTKPFRSSTRMCWTAGARPAPRSFPSRRLPTSLRPTTAMPAGFPAAIPELHAGAPCGTPDRFLAGLRAFAETHPVHGECGGYMVLGRSLEDATGEVHPMAGLLPVATSYAKRKLHLGYRVATLLRMDPLDVPAQGSSATNSTMRRSSKRTCGRKSRSARLPMPKATQSARPGTASPG